VTLQYKTKGKMGIDIVFNNDIVKAHGEEINVETNEGEARPNDSVVQAVGRCSQFILKLPLTKYNMKMKKDKSSLIKDDLQKEFRH